MRGRILVSALFVAALIASLAMPGIVVATAPTKVSVEPPSFTDIFPGDTFSVDLRIDEVVGLNAWQVKVYFNAWMLKVNSVTEGPFLKDAPGVPPGQTFFIWKVSPLGDYVTIGVTYKKAYEASGSGLLATIVFKCMGAGTTKLDLQALLLNKYGYTIETTVSGGSVNQKAVAEVTGRTQEHQRCPSDTPNTLYARVGVSASIPYDTVQVYTVFSGVAMDGSPIILEAATQTFGKGSEEAFAVTFDTPSYGVGSYEFEVRAFFSYDGIAWYRGEVIKSLGFVVIP